jgi:protein ImuB
MIAYSKTAAASRPKPLITAGLTINSTQNLPTQNLPTQRRFLAIALPYLATDRIERRLRLAEDERGPLATVERAASTLRLAAVNPAAAAHGLTRGLSLADARARMPDLSLADTDPDGERRNLESLADWCCRWTPYVGLDAPDGLMLDITGCAHLFGGEASLRQTILARLAAQGFTAQALRASRQAALSPIPAHARL